jgi:O-antigen/teichoic acid export membrane protein
MLTSQVITWISSFVLMLFLPRYLGSADYGRLYLAISITMIFQMLIEFGGSYLIVKEVSRRREETPSILVHSLAIRLIMWLISIVAMIALAYFARYSFTVTVLIMIFGISKLWEGAGKVLSSCFQGFEMMQYPALGTITERILVALCGVIALLLGAHSIVIAIIWVASSLLNFGVVVKFARRIVSYLPQVHWNDVKILTKASVPYFLWSVFAVVYYRVDAIMLSLMAPEVVVGWYGAAYRFFDILMFLPSIFSTAMFPILSKLWGKDNDSLSSMTHKSLEFMLLAGIPISVLAFAGAEHIIGLFFGLQEYGPSVILLRIFSVGLLLVYIDFILISTLVASDRHRQWTIAALVAMVINPVLNYFMIPFTQMHFGNGGIGAAIATLITELLVMCMALYLMPRKIFEHAHLQISLKGILAGLLMVGAIYGMSRYDIAFILQAIIGLGIYGVALLTMKAVQQSEVVFVQQLFMTQNIRKLFAVEKGINP